MSLSKPRILIAHTSLTLGQHWQALIKHEGYDCTLVHSEAQIIHGVYDKPPDLVLLNWSPAQMDVFALIRRWREDGVWQRMQLFVISQQPLQAEKIAALQAGVDDWLSQPFDEQELIARLAARLRRARIAMFRPVSQSETQQVGWLSFDARALRLSARTKMSETTSPIKLGPTELRLAQALIDNADRMMSRELLKIAIWGRHSEVDERSVDVPIKRLRESISEVSPAAAAQIETVRGMGYRLTSTKPFKTHWSYADPSLVEGFLN